MNIRLMAAIAVTAASQLLAGCGGGGGGIGGTGSTAMGTLRVSLTDSPACGYDNVWITVEKVRVHRDSSAGDGDAGWVDLPLPLPAPLPTPQPLRVDLLTLTNGTLVPLGQVQLPAGTYTQMRLVLAENTASNPYANAITPTGGSMAPLTTPSAQQSGLKMNVDMTVPAGQEADFAIDFDACKSIVKAGKSGKILLKPVLSVLPILSPAGQRIQGWLDPSLATAGATVSVQAGGGVVIATPPMMDSGGNLKFELYPVPVGSYNLVVTARGYSTAIVTGVPAYANASTTVNSVAFPILPPASNLQTVSGTVTFGASAVDTGGVVRALQLLTGGPTIEVASANADQLDGSYEVALPLGVPVKARYVIGTVPLVFEPDVAVMASYRLAATVARSTEVQFDDIVLGATPVQRDLNFGAAPAGQLIQGWLDPSLAVRGTQVSVQVNGAIVRTTPPLPDDSGKFVLYPVPVGTYDLVVTSANHVTAVMTGVPVVTTAYTYVNSALVPIAPPPLATVPMLRPVTGTVTPATATVRALQFFTDGPMVEVAWGAVDATTGAFGFALPIAAPVKTAYVPNPSSLVFVADVAVAGKYTLEASSSGVSKVHPIDTAAPVSPVTFVFP